MCGPASMPTPSESFGGGLCPPPTALADHRPKAVRSIAAVDNRLGWRKVAPASGGDGTGPASPVHPGEAAADLALCRSALYEALALGLSPPSPETMARLTSPEGAGALAAAAAVLDAPLAEVVRRLARPATLERLWLAYARLFGHIARGAVPPYETEYGADSLFQPIHEMSDLTAFYRAFGLRLRPEAHERSDHVSCECEFLAFLARKEAHALACDDPVMLDGTRQAIRRFLRDHLGRWAPAFGRTLARQDSDGFFGTLGTLCAAFVSHECTRVGIPAGPEFLRLRSTSLPDAPAACGSPEDPVEAPRGAV